jgi:hypothetical protein
VIKEDKEKVKRKIKSKLGDYYAVKKIIEED